MYGQIISFLFILLILYYVVMIFLDLQKAKAAKAAELEKNSEEDIDISDEANTFQPIIVSRDEPKKVQEAEPQTEKDKVGESTEQTPSKDYHQSETKESDQDNKDSSVEKPSYTASSQTIPPVNPVVKDSTSKKAETPHSEVQDKPKEVNPQPYKREGYREPLMTGGVLVETILQQVDEYAETGQGPLGEIIFECRSAHF